jgi:hypothetical protein
MSHVTSGQETQVLKILRDKRVSGKVLTELLCGYLTSLIESGRQGMLPDIDTFREMLGIQYRVRVTPDLAELIEKGEYNYVGGESLGPFNSFPVPKGLHEYEVLMELVFPGRPMWMDSVIKRLAGNRRAPSIHEFVAFGAQYPELQLLFPIVGLIPNPVFDYNFGWGYPVLMSRKTSDPENEVKSRELKLVHGIYQWDSDCRFAVVRK